MLADLQKTLLDRCDLSREQMEFFLRESLSGSLSDAEKKAILELQNAKGISADEICFAAQILGNFSETFPAIDVCGTGGSGLPRINASTLSAFVLAALGVPVAKHGNRASSGRFGSFDLLESLHIQINLSPEQSRECVESVGIGFFFAPRCYPEMAAFGAVRKAMGVPTMFNLLGPVLSPLNPEAQLVGVSQHKDMPLLLSACLGLGRKKVSVVHGSDGLDEVTMTGTTDVVSSGGTESVLTPEMFGVESVPFVDIQGGGKEENLAFAQEFLFEKQVNSPRANLVLLNTAMALSVFTESDDFPSLFQRAKEAVRNGSAEAIFRKLQEKTGALLSSS